MQQFRSILAHEDTTRIAAKIDEHWAEGNLNEALSYAVNYCAEVFEKGHIPFCTVPPHIFKAWAEYITASAEAKGTGTISPQQRDLIRAMAYDIYAVCQVWQRSQ
jgi:hypothetical protein